MSYEAWGDGDDCDYDHLLEAGWWTDEQANEVVEAIKALESTPLYEAGQKANGVSVEFLMRLTLLRVAAGLDVPEPLVREATDYFASK